MRAVFYASLSRRISSVVAISLCFSPQPVICSLCDGSESKRFVSDVVTHISDGSSHYLIEKFDELEQSIQSCRNPIEENRKFLRSFIEEINIQHGLHLTIHEACILVSKSLYALQMPQEVQKLLLETILLLEPDFSLTTEQTQHFGKMNNLGITSLRISWPWEWNWFGLNKKSHKHSSPSSVPCFIPSPTLLQQAASSDEELPGTMYIGGVETFAGALVFIIGLAFPPAYGAGAALMVDGVRRVFNGLEELDKQRPPGSEPLSGPFEVNF